MRRPQRKRLKGEDLPPDAGMGFENQTVCDYEDWLGHLDGETVNWIYALEALNRHGDKGPLIEMLRTSVPTPAACRYLAETLEHHRLIREERGRNRWEPEYDRAQIQLAYEAAERDWREAGAVPEDIEQFAKHWTLDKDQLTEHIAGNRRQDQRVKARSKPPKRPKNP